MVENDNAFLPIDYPASVDNFTCFVDINDELKNSSIQSCLKKDFSTRLIQTIDVVEKCVYFEHLNGICHLMCFSNLEHCS